MNDIALAEILKAHALWLRADLRDADLRHADLWHADLQYADLQNADLQNANLQDANLQNANLQGADLQNANLRGAKLRGADLQGADLRHADLRHADLQDANLQDANLQDAKLPDYGILPTTATFTAYKKVRNNVVLELEVQRQHAVCSLVGRKCRASEVLVVSASAPGPYVSMHDPLFTYQIGLTAKAPLNPDPRVECTSGIHFFLTREEAKAY